MKIIWIKPKKIIALTLILITLIVGIRYSIDYIEKTMYPIKYSEYVEKYSSEFELDPWLVLSVIWVESKFDSTATSNKDARGLMQVTPMTGKWAAEELELIEYDDELLYDPETNIKIGCWYLDKLRTQFDNRLQLIIAAYNGGSGNVAEWLKDERYSDDEKTLKEIPFGETEKYVEKVFKTYEKYREIYEKDDTVNLN